MQPCDFSVLLHRREELGLPEHVKLLPESTVDKQTARLVRFQTQEQRFQHNWQNKRRKVLTESIFPAPGASTPAIGKQKGSIGSAAGSSSGKTGLREQLPQLKLVARKRKVT